MVMIRFPPSARLMPCSSERRGILLLCLKLARDRGTLFKAGCYHLLIIERDFYPGAISGMELNATRYVYNVTVTNHLHRNQTEVGLAAVSGIRWLHVPCELNYCFSEDVNISNENTFSGYGSNSNSLNV